jgi:hypothetical protein
MNTLVQLDVEINEILRLLNLKSCDFVYIGGSFTAGFHNEASDIDVFLVYGDDREVDFQGHQMFLGHRRIDIQNMTYTEWRNLSTKVSKACSEDVHSVTSKEIMTFFRTSIGLPLVQRERFYFERGSYFDQTVLSTLLHKIYTKEMDDQSAKINGALELGWATKAIDCLKQYIHSYMALYCAGRGENYPNHKWRYEKLYKIHGKDHPITLKFRNMENSCALIQNAQEIHVMLEQLSNSSVAENLSPSAYRLVIDQDVVSAQIGEHCFLIKENHAYEFSASVIRLWEAAKQARGQIYIHKEDIRVYSSFFRQMEVYELFSLEQRGIGMDEECSRLADSLVFIKKHNVHAIVERRIKGWMAWIDYQSFYDDCSGARKAKQYEAALIAVRKMLIEVLKLWISEKDGYFPGSQFVLEYIALSKPSTYKELAYKLNTMPPKLSDIDSHIEDLLQLCTAYLSDGVPEFPGNIRDEAPHQDLFEFGSQWIRLARILKLPIPLSNEMIRKVDDLMGSRKGAAE